MKNNPLYAQMILICADVSKIKGQVSQTMSHNIDYIGKMAFKSISLAKISL